MDMLMSWTEMILIVVCFIEQGTFSLIVEAYHQSSNSTGNILIN